MRKPALGAALIVVAVALMSAVPAAASQQAGTPPPTPPPVIHGLKKLNLHVPKTHLPERTAPTGSSSGNWSGIVDVAASGQHIRYIRSYFSVPSVNCANSVMGPSGIDYAYHWVGLDGWTDSTVEQVGVAGYCTSSSGSPSYFAWYEMYPQSPVVFSGINPGDAINAWVYYTGSAWSLELRDLTNGASINTSQPCAFGSVCNNTSGEVISEDPGGAVASGYYLPDFGLANYLYGQVKSLSGVTGNLAAKSGAWTETPVNMVNGSTTMATPSSLEGGQAFFDTWKSSS